MPAQGRAAVPGDCPWNRHHLPPACLNIDLATGEAIAPDVGCVRTFDVKQVGADLFIKVESGGAVTEKAEPVDA